jgi:hypothetical protein
MAWRKGVASALALAYQSRHGAGEGISAWRNGVSSANGVAKSGMAISENGGVSWQRGMAASRKHGGIEISGSG